MDPSAVVVDGSNIATEGRSTPSLAQLDEAVRAFQEEFPDLEVIVVVDASFGHRIDPSEVAAFDEAVAHSEMVSPPAGAIGRGDAFVLRIAERVGGQVLSNDSFQEFHGEHPWLFDKNRLIGGKPVPGAGWIFTLRNPVRGARSRQAIAEQDGTSTGPAAGASARARPPARAQNGERPKIGDVRAAPVRKASAAKVAKLVDAAMAAESSVTPDEGDAAAPTKAAKAAKTGKAAKATKATKATKGAKEAAPAKAATKAAKATKTSKVAKATEGTKEAKPTKAAKVAKEAKEAKAAKEAKEAKEAKVPKAAKTTKKGADAAPVTDVVEPDDLEPPKSGRSRTGASRRRRRRSAVGPEVQAAIDVATVEATTPPDSPDAGPSSGRRRRGKVPPAALNDPLTFVTFVTEHPIGASVIGTVASFVSHGAMVDVGEMHCYVPLGGLGVPPPRKAREVLEQGESREFVLVGLDPPRRGAELALPELAHFVRNS